MTDWLFPSIFFFWKAGRWIWFALSAAPRPKNCRCCRRNPPTFAIRVPFSGKVLQNKKCRSHVPNREISLKVLLPEADRDTLPKMLIKVLDSSQLWQVPASTRILKINFAQRREKRLRYVWQRKGFISPTKGPILTFLMPFLPPDCFFAGSVIFLTPATQ